MPTASSIARSARASTPPVVQAQSPAWWRRPWAVAVLGNVLLWAALPPLSLGLLAWMAPVPWVLLIRRRELTGRRVYFGIWLASFAFWLAALYWLTLPHWATSFGLLALAAYLGLYLPLFIGLSRVAVHRLGVSVIAAAPVVYVGFEFARAHLLSGFAMASIAHTQVQWPILLQISDLGGGYAVSFAMVLVAAALARILPLEGQRVAAWPLGVAAAMLAVMLGYGQWRLSEATTRPGPKVALIQGSIDIQMKHDPTLFQRVFDEYYDLSRLAVRGNSDLDLIVWPETMFRPTWYTHAPGLEKSQVSETEPQELADGTRKFVEKTVQSLGVSCLLGVDSNYESPDRVERYNSGLFTDRDGHALGRYDKCHLVAFGEYVPLARWFPWLYRLSPLPHGLDAGHEPLAVSIGSTRYAANICYENTLPHIIRGQVATLRAAGKEPDVLVNLTNDGWFWGSSELDMHLACAVFRAIECRKPFLIAANTGFSAAIDSNGRIQSQGRRRQRDVIVAQTALDTRRSPYLVYGDLPAFLCLLGCVGLGVVGILCTYRYNRPSSDTHESPKTSR